MNAVDVGFKDIVQALISECPLCTRLPINSISIRFSGKTDFIVEAWYYHKAQCISRDGSRTWTWMDILTYFYTELKHCVALCPSNVFLDNICPLYV